MRSDYISEEETEKILSSLTTANKLVIRVSAKTGLRVSDVLNLKIGDIILAQKNKYWLQVVEKKTGKMRKVRLDEELCADLRNCTTGRKSEDFIFPHRLDKNRHRTRQAVWAQLNKKTKNGVLVVSPHSFRKQYAVNVFQNSGGNIERLQKDLRHEFVGTTMIYAMSDATANAKRKAYEKNQAKKKA